MLTFALGGGRGGKGGRGNQGKARGEEEQELGSKVNKSEEVDKLQVCIFY